MLYLLNDRSINSGFILSNNWDIIWLVFEEKKSKLFKVSIDRWIQTNYEFEWLLKHFSFYELITKLIEMKIEIKLCYV
jgi:hypothetical protein